MSLLSFLCLQVLALVFIRKLLDFCFSKRELSYLDDLMPEWKKKNLDDASKKMEEVEKKPSYIHHPALTCLWHSCLLQESQIMLSVRKDDTVQIPMESSKPLHTSKAHDPRCLSTNMWCPLWILTYWDLPWQHLHLILCFPPPCSSGLTPLILIYLMKCLKPPCGNPSTPIKRTYVLWLLKRQGHPLFFPFTSVLWKWSYFTLWSLASSVVLCRLRTASLCFVLL